MENKVVKIIVIVDENSNGDLDKTLYSVTSENYNNFKPILFIKEGLEFNANHNIETIYYEDEKDIYNKAKLIVADYITFLKAGDSYSKNFCEKVNRRIEKEDKIIVFNVNGKYRFNNKEKGIIRIEDNPDSFIIHLYGNVINKKIFNQIEIDEINCKYDLDINIFTKILMIVGEMYKIDKIKFNHLEIFDDIINNKLEYYDLIWYMDIFNNINNLVEFSRQKFNSIIKYLQNIIMYMIKLRMEVSVNTKNKHILSEENIEDYYNAVYNILQEIDDLAILHTLGNKKINEFLLKLKSNKENSIKYREYTREIYLMSKNNIIDSASRNKIKILLMNIENNELEIVGTYPFDINESNMEIIAETDDNEYLASKSYLYNIYKCFGKEIYTNYTFSIKIKLNNIKKQYIKFFLKSDNSKVKLDIIFSKPLSRLNKEKSSYWVEDKYILNYRKKSILVMKNTILRQIKREYKYITSLLTKKEEVARKSGRLRILYWITKPLLKNKQIWLFQDKIYKGGDNGEYLYKYCVKQKDKINKYYILDKKCLDTQRFKKDKIKFVKYNSLKHKLLFLNSNIVFATHNNTVTANGFTVEDEIYFRDLYKYKSVCIQHGLSVQYIPHLVNRINDDLRMFFLASDIEKENLLKPEYEYTNKKEILKVTGSPRYDGLKNNDQKIILITPSWRNYLALPVIKREEKRGYNNNFKESNYYKIYNSLINNDKLIKKAKDNNYKIIYLLHPATSSQINDYDKNEYVELIAATDNLNYEKILTESSLMVTDYSGVQFDFAYMYKPIIYFHSKELPPSYDEGEYKYSTMALGEIVDTEKKLVDLLCDYMDNGCKVKEKYKSRIDKFFKYHDFNNCERVYNEIMKKFYTS